MNSRYSFDEVVRIVRVPQCWKYSVVPKEGVVKGMSDPLPDGSREYAVYLREIDRLYTFAENSLEAVGRVANEQDLSPLVPPDSSRLLPYQILANARATRGPQSTNGSRSSTKELPMVRHLGNLTQSDRCGATYIAPFSVRNGPTLASRLAELCVALAELFSRLSVDPRAQSRVWICIDRRDPDVPPRETHAIVSVFVRFDFLRPGALPEYHSIQSGITILRPGDFDLLKSGWQSFREWLLGRLLQEWRAALTAQANKALRAVLANTHVWIRGQPEHMFGYDSAGEPVAVEFKLSGSEDSYALFSDEPTEEETDFDV